MQSNHEYENMVRALHLANDKGQPFVPYDLDEMKVMDLKTLTKLSPIYRLPLPGNWHLYSYLPIVELGNMAGIEFANVPVYLRDATNKNPYKEFGIMYSPKIAGFVLLYKSANEGE